MGVNWDQHLLAPYKRYLVTRLITGLLVVSQLIPSAASLIGLIPPLTRWMMAAPLIPPIPF